ncbi:unnamed protein product [Heterobilharzia americana]|nr:unnamed protein product [Heterobilharzia americana]
MASGSRELLRLFAATIQNASTLAGEMRFIDLNSAFKMTCELQQRVVDLIYAHKKHLIALEAIARIKQEDPGPTTGEEVSVQHENADTENSERGDCENIAPDENNEAKSGNSHVGALSCNTKNTNEEVRNTEPPNSQVNNIFDVFVANPSKQACTSSTEKHRLVSIESLYEDIFPDGVESSPTNDSSHCRACQLRNQVQSGVTITMVCAACPGFPRICSAQCFRWWHSVYSPKVVSDSRTAESIHATEEESTDQNNSKFQLSSQCGEKISVQSLSAASERQANKRKTRRKYHRFNPVVPHPHQEASVWPKQLKNIIPTTVRRKRGRPRKTPVYINFKDPEWTPYRKY